MRLDALSIRPGLTGLILGAAATAALVIATTTTVHRVKPPEIECIMIEAPREPIQVPAIQHAPPPIRMEACSQYLDWLRALARCPQMSQSSHDLEEATRAVEQAWQQVPQEAWPQLQAACAQANEALRSSYDAMSCGRATALQR